MRPKLNEKQKEEYARIIGESIRNIACPRCNSDKDEDGQFMSPTGDFPNNWFCPHCELEFDICIE